MQDLTIQTLSTMKNPQITTTRDFRGQEYISEITRYGNVTVKRNFEIWRGQFFAGMRLFNAYTYGARSQPPRGSTGYYSKGLQVIAVRTNRLYLPLIPQRLILKCNLVNHAHGAVSQIMRFDRT